MSSSAVARAWRRSLRDNLLRGSPWGGAASAARPASTASASGAAEEAAAAPKKVPPPPRKVELAECLERDGFKSVQEAVGADF